MFQTHLGQHVTRNKQWIAKPLSLGFLSLNKQQRNMASFTSNCIPLLPKTPRVESCLAYCQFFSLLPLVAHCQELLVIIILREILLLYPLRANWTLHCTKLLNLLLGYNMSEWTANSIHTNRLSVYLTPSSALCLSHSQHSSNVGPSSKVQSLAKGNFNTRAEIQYVYHVM